MENEKIGFECLFLLSLSHDDFCLGKDKDIGKDGRKDEEKGKGMDKNNGKDKGAERGIERGKDNLKNKQNHNLQNKNNGEDKNNSRDKIDSIAWVRCLIVIEKKEKNERREKIEIPEEIEIEGDLMPLKMTDFESKEINVGKNVRNVQCGSQRCLPNIFKKKIKSTHNENIENESENENENENRSEVFADKILFPGFFKDLFSASWRGGKKTEKAKLKN